MEWKTKMNLLGKQRKPFLFVIDFLKQTPFVYTLEELRCEDVFFEIEGIRNYPSQESKFVPHILNFAIDFDAYKKKFIVAQHHLSIGNSYLINVCCQTPIQLNCSLKQLFEHARADYKLYFKNQFVLFSPECFVKIEDNRISTYPMKGTIDANVPNAVELVLNSSKEKNEHDTTIDLLRNDLGIIAQDIRLTKYRFLKKIKTQTNQLLQIVSEITGTIQPQYENSFGDIFDALLPAGSICGAPKNKTVQIIQEIESPRNFYTGVFGYYDGKKLNSAVMIRFVSKQEEKYFYHSGGGVTSQSNLQDEYEELKNKIYVPIY